MTAHLKEALAVWVPMHAQVACGSPAPTAPVSSAEVRTGARGGRSAALPGVLCPVSGVGQALAFPVMLALMGAMGVSTVSLSRLCEQEAGQPRPAAQLGFH